MLYSPLNSNQTNYDSPAALLLKHDSSNKTHTPPKNRGFTIIELMVTIAIVSVIAAIAMPNLNAFLVRMRVDNEVSEMHRLLLTARNNAINSGLDTTVCPLDGGSTCTNNWKGTISVFTNASGVANKMDGTDTLIKIKEAIKANDKLELTIDGELPNDDTIEMITYTPTGRTLTGTAKQLTYCPFDYSAESNGIDVSTSGRSYIGSQNNSNEYIDRLSNVFTCI